MKQAQQNGFTLIELMVVVAIIGILAAIAYPSYTDSVRKSRRADAMGALLGFANAMERYFTQFNTYCDIGGTGATAANNCGNAAVNDTGIPPGAVYAPPAATAVNYTFTISAATANTYTLTATRVAGSSQANDRCGNLTLTNTGIKGFTGGGGLTRADCW